MKTVLHIASHMGGGVGKVLSNVAIAKSKEWEHKIILLETPIDVQFTDKCLKKNVDIRFSPDINTIRTAIEGTDIVQFDWWQNPVLSGLFPKIEDLDMRCVVWSHTAGCYYPYLNPDFVKLPHHFIFSSHYSKENPGWKLSDLFDMKTTSVINSSGGFSDTWKYPLKPHSNFNVGYVGTLGYVKLRPDFIEYCKSVRDIPGIRFVMIGRIPEPNLVLRDAEKAGIADKFVFKGYVKDLPAELAELDVLGYLLNPNHFGTTENAMLEAMSMGIPPICINQCAEKYLIQNRETGYLVSGKQEYATVLMGLYQDAVQRKLVGSFAKWHVIEHLGLGNTITKLNKVYERVMLQQKWKISFSSVFGKTPYDWYKSGLPPVSCGSELVSSYLVDSTKGSVAQWQKYYPDDKKLAKVRQ